MKTSIKPGRPTEFDTDHALDVAMHLFWDRGYEGTSMADLSQKMGIHPSSIYAAFSAWCSPTTTCSCGRD